MSGKILKFGVSRKKLHEVATDMELRHKKWNGQDSRACCEWRTFEEGLLHSAEHIGLPKSLISWRMAQHFWYRLSMTGYEAAVTLKQRLIRKENRDRSKSIHRIESARSTS